MSAAEGSVAVALFFVDRAAGHDGNQHANSAFVGPPVTSPKKSINMEQGIFPQLCFKST